MYCFWYKPFWDIMLYNMYMYRFASFVSVLYNFYIKYLLLKRWKI